MDSCWNCGYRMRNEVCNNPNSSQYRHHAGHKCDGWIKQVYVPPGWLRGF